MGKLVLPVHVEWKAGSSSGEVEGYAAVFGNVDRIDDVVMPGAFARTIQHWRKSRQILPLTVDHDMSTGGTIGSITHLEEDARGLRFKARLASTAKAQDIRTLILEGHLSSTSFTYEIIRSAAGRLAGKAVRLLEELRLHEITIASGIAAINELAGITAAKAVTDIGSASFDSWVTSMEHALAIGHELARKAAVAELVASYQTDQTEIPAPASEDAPGTADDTATDDGGTSTPHDAFAVSWLKEQGQPDGAPNGDSPPALPEFNPLADLERQRSEQQIDALEAELQALGGDQQ